MGRASNWAKFTATASIGVVHRGHMKESMSLLQPYLPQGGVSALPYSEGGALYALGLIHSNKGSDGNAEVCWIRTPVSISVSCCQQAGPPVLGCTANNSGLVWCGLVWSGVILEGSCSRVTT